MPSVISTVFAYLVAYLLTADIVLRLASFRLGDDNQLRVRQAINSFAASRAVPKPTATRLCTHIACG